MKANKSTFRCIKYHVLFFTPTSHFVKETCTPTHSCHCLIRPIMWQQCTYSLRASDNHIEHQNGGKYGLNHLVVVGIIWSGLSRSWDVRIKPHKWAEQIRTQITTLYSRDEQKSIFDDLTNLSEARIAKDQRTTSGSNLLYLTKHRRTGSQYYQKLDNSKLEKCHLRFMSHSYQEGHADDRVIIWC